MWWIIGAVAAVGIVAVGWAWYGLIQGRKDEQVAVVPAVDDVDDELPPSNGVVHAWPDTDYESQYQTAPRPMIVEPTPTPSLLDLNDDGVADLFEQQQPLTYDDGSSYVDNTPASDPQPSYDPPAPDYCPSTPDPTPGDSGPVQQDYCAPAPDPTPPATDYGTPSTDYGTSGSYDNSNSGW